MPDYKEYKILLKTIADVTGASKLGRWFVKHSKDVRGLVATYKVLKAAGAAAMKGIHDGAVLAGRVLKKLSVGIIAVTGAIGGAVREFVAFNAGMARAWTMMGDTGVKAFMAIRREIVKMSGDLGVAKDQLSAGLYQALSKGVPQDNVLEFLSKAAKVAIADGSDVAPMVDGITTVINAFGRDIKETDDILDKMFMTVKTGGTTFAELASYMFQAAPVASAAGLALEDVNGAVVALTKGGTPTRVAMTQIRAAIDALNRVLGDGWAKNMSFAEGLQKVRDMSRGSDNALVKLVGTIEAKNAILGMTNEKANLLTDAMREQQQAAGSLNDAYSKVDNQIQHWPKLWQTIRGLVTRIGEAFDKTLAPVVDDITKQLGTWRDKTTFFDKLEQKLQKMVTHARNMWAAIAGGEGGTLLEGLMDMLVGSLRLGAEKAVELLFKMAPLIGDLIGQAAKRALSDVGLFYAADKEALKSMREEGLITKAQEMLPATLLTPELAQERERRRNAITRDVLRAEGEDAAAELPRTAEQQIEEGKSKVKFVGEYGAAKRDYDDFMAGQLQKAAGESGEAPPPAATGTTPPPAATGTTPPPAATGTTAPPAATGGSASEQITELERERDELKNIIRDMQAGMPDAETALQATAKRERSEADAAAAEYDRFSGLSPMQRGRDGIRQLQAKKDAMLKEAEEAVRAEMDISRALDVTLATIRGFRDRQRAIEAQLMAINSQLDNQDT